MFAPDFNAMYTPQAEAASSSHHQPDTSELTDDATLLHHLPQTLASKGHKRGRVLRRWHKRYLVLKGSFLLVHKVSRKSFAEAPSNVLDLRGAKLKATGLSHCKKEASFTVAPVGQKRATHLSVPPAVFDEWFGALQRAAQRRRNPSLRDFHTVRKLGSGGTATVWLVRHKRTGRLHALKRVLKRGNVEAIEKKFRGLAQARRRLVAITAQLSRNVQHICEERAAYQTLAHPNAMALDFAFQDDEAWYLVSKYYSGGNLYDLLKKQPERRFQEAVVRHWAAQLVSVLEHTHATGYAHRDIKPENVLVDEHGNVNLIDFGFTKRLKRGERTNTFCGTKYYIAPEMIRGSHAHGTAVDWWALGVMLFELVTGYPPFPQRDLPTLYDKILNEPLEFSEEQEQTLSPQLRDLIHNLLIKEPWNRLGHRQLDEGKGGLTEIRQHPFFADVDWAAIDAGSAAVPFGLCTGSSADQKEDSCARTAACASGDRCAFIVWSSEKTDADLSGVEAKTRSNSSDSADSGSDDPDTPSQSSVFLHLEGFSYYQDEEEEEEEEVAVKPKPSAAVFARFDTPEHLQVSTAILAA